MDAEKRARIARIAGIVCLAFGLLDAAFAIFAMIAEKSVHKGMPGIAMALSMFAIGVVCLARPWRRPPPKA